MSSSSITPAGQEPSRSFPTKIVVGASVLAVTLTVGIGAFLSLALSDLHAAGQRRLRIQHLSGKILHLDEVLTMSAKMCVATGNMKWKRRYDKHVTELDRAIEEAARLVPSAEPEKELGAINSRLVDMERQAFDLVAQGRTQEAMTLLESDQYEIDKLAYSQSTQEMVNAMNREAKASLDAQSNVVHAAYIAVAVATCLILGSCLTGLTAVRQHFAKRKEAEEKLLANQKALQAEKALGDAMIASLPGLFYVFNEQGYHVRWNKNARDYHGVTDEEMPRTHYLDNIPDEHKPAVEKAFAEALKSGFVELEHAAFHGPARETRTYLSNGLRVSNDGVAYIVGISLDITDRKEAEQERERLITELEARNTELEQFTYTVSHELKTPLITISGFAGMLQQDLEEGRQQGVESHIDRICKGTDRMQRLLADLSDLLRLGRLVNPSEDVSLVELTREAIELVNESAQKKDVQFEIAPDLPMVFGDRIRLLEAVRQLLDNAVKFMGEQSQPRVEIGSRRDGDETVYYVRDNGIGIDPKYHERVFTLFEQLDPQAAGSGIGLALVKRIVEIHGGRVWVESEGLDSGTTFCFTLAPKGDSDS